jgi:hypothetical protein
VLQFCLNFWHGIGFLATESQYSRKKTVMKRNNMKKQLPRRWGNCFALAAGLGTMAVGLAIVSSTAQAAGFDLGDAANYTVLFEGGGGNKLNINNPSALFAHIDGGNIGIDNTGQLQLSGPLTINGNVDFANSVIDNGPYSGNVAVNGTIIGGHANVHNDLVSLNGLSTTLSGEAGASVALNSGAAINGSAGTLDASGNRVFTVSGINAPNGTLTINGDGHKVVFNVSAAANANFHFNNIVLGGGLTSDDVQINFFGGSSLTGGPTLDINSNGGNLYGVFLDPNGAISVVSTLLNGRVFGGDSHDEALVSGATIIAPSSVPDGGSSMLLLSMGVGLIVAAKKKLVG